MHFARVRPRRRGVQVAPTFLILLVVFSISSLLLLVSLGTSLLVSRGAGDTENFPPWTATHNQKTPPYDDFFQATYEEIDNENKTTLCSRYGYEFDPSDKDIPRRLFMGAMVADDPFLTIQAHAVEVYNLGHVFVLSESNTTHRGTPRIMRFVPPASPFSNGTNGLDTMYERVVTDKIFGPNTHVRMSYWFEASNRTGMPRERQQRNTIINEWIAAGMTEKDVAIMGDMDEFFTRPFLLALKYCRLPLRVTNGSCKHAKIYARSQQFEMSPECSRNMKERSWHHPDAMLGSCLQGLGNTTGRPERQYKDDLLAKCGYGVSCGERKTPGWIRKYKPEVFRDGLYPLWSGTDMRENLAGHLARVQPSTADQGSLNRHHHATAFHLHNQFNDLKTLRTKYATYGHFDQKLESKRLGEIEGDVGCAVRCVFGIPNLAMWGSKVMNEPGLENLIGSRPIFFQNMTYRKERHEQVVQMILKDMQEYGLPFNESIMALATMNFDATATSKSVD